MMLAGAVTLNDNGAEHILLPLDALCRKAGDPVAHRLDNLGENPARYMVISHMRAFRRDTYPDQDRILHFDRIADSRRYTMLDGATAGKP